MSSISSNDYECNKILLALIHEKSKRGEFNDSQLEHYLKEVWETTKKAPIEKQMILLEETQKQVQLNCQQLKELIEGKNSSVNGQSEVTNLIKNLEFIIKMAEHYRQHGKKPNIFQKMGQLLKSKFLRKLAEDEEKLWKDPLYSLIYIQRYFKNTSQRASSTQIKQLHRKRVLFYVDLCLSLSEKISVTISRDIKEESQKMNPQYFVS